MMFLFCDRESSQSPLSAIERKKEKREKQSRRQLESVKMTDNSQNPFFSLEDDVDDETFLKSGPNYSNNSFEDKRQQLFEARKAIEERTLESSKRSISLLQNSEDVGINTAQELVRQREQLERVDEKLDDTNSMLRTSQKHIRGIKSIFGSFRNYWSGSNRSENAASSNSSSPSEARRTSTVKSSDSFSNIPEESPKPELNQVSSCRNPPNFEAALDRNLDEMSGSLARLKGLAINLSSEIDNQNDLLDNINDKIEIADTMMAKQNKDMRQLLKK